MIFVELGLTVSVYLIKMDYGRNTKFSLRKLILALLFLWGTFEMYPVLSNIFQYKINIVENSKNHCVLYDSNAYFVEGEMIPVCLPKEWSKVSENLNGVLVCWHYI
ncbi:hypothetical protein HS088_TW17G00156 [Tripterygium wilfordii]|uniref:Uncharacterized protein n=1 Tax=Tripterygium wilfordii TaxID=458696 RepID=A0A7J7CFW2_TRIWF|nr:hypothetical protein HS088_TW17G00156 [Tripterygium wilfordii]